MATFILVHGMFHGAWAWVRVKDALEARGHRVIAEDLAGCAADTTPPGEVTLDRWVQATARAIEEAGEPVILVGHSRGGVVVAQTCEAAPERVAAAVYFSALLLPDGTAGFGLTQLLAADGVEAELIVVPTFNADGTAMFAPDDAPDLFYGCCTPEDRDWAVPQMGAEPIAPSMQPLSLTAERFGSVPRIYIETTADRTVPIAAQRAMIAHAQPIEVFSLEADHMANMTHGEELGAILDRVAHRHAGADAVPAGA